MTQNLHRFSRQNSFSKMIVSIMANIMIQQKELNLIKAQFEKMDTNHDGLISQDELEAGLSMLNLSQIFGLKKGLTNKDVARKLMRELDADGDGSINFSEFIAAAIDQTALLNLQNIKNLFCLLDENNDWQLTKEEL